MIIRYDIIVVACIASVLLVFQIIPLLWGKPFYDDWINHVWVVEYYSAYLKQQGSFPTTIDVIQEFGSPLPIFYGVFSYPLLSVISVITGADLAVRIVSGILILAPMIAFMVLFRVLTKDMYLAILLATTVNASVYQLTNLYARSAITEFVAFHLLLLSIALVFYGLIRNSRIGNATLSLGFACATLAIGSHPITFYTFLIFVAPLLFFGYFSFRRVILPPQLLRALFWGICAFIILLPWVINVFKYSGELAIHIKSMARLYYFPNSIDSLWGKLGLFYVDSRVLFNGIDGVSTTPFLDAPFQLGLMLILLMVFIRLVLLDRKEFYILIVPSLLCIFAVVYAVIPPHELPASGSWQDTIFVANENGFLYKLLMPLQFAYRLSGTLSLCMTVALLAGISALYRTSRPENLTPSLLAVAYMSALIALIGVGQKLYVTYAEFVAYPAYRERTMSHSLPPSASGIFSIKGKRYKGSDYNDMLRNINSYPATFYWQRTYSMPRMFPSSSIAADTKNMKLISFHAAQYGKATSIVCDQPCILRTNIIPSKFHQVLIDDFEPKDIRISGGGNLEFSMSAGSHTLKINKTGGIIYYISASIWLMLLWFFGSLIIFGGLVMNQITSKNKAVAKLKVIAQ